MLFSTALLPPKIKVSSNRMTVGLSSFESLYTIDWHDQRHLCRVSFGSSTENRNEKKDIVRLDESCCSNPCRKQWNLQLKQRLQKQTGWDRGDKVNWTWQWNPLWKWYKARPGSRFLILKVQSPNHIINLTRELGKNQNLRPHRIRI